MSANPLTAIDWGTKLSATTIDVYFAARGDIVDGGTSLGWLPFEKQQAMTALRQIEHATNLHFRETSNPNGAEFRLATTIFTDNTIAFMIPPGEAHAGLAAFDVRLLEAADADSGNSLLNRGGWGFAILLEEFGHGLGLAHPHDDGGSSTILQGVTDPVGSYGVGKLNQGVFTVMGYNEGWPGGPEGQSYLTNDGGTLTVHVNDFGYEATMMALDVAVLQRKYGANMAFATGADTYRLPDANRIGTMFQCIWDAGGTDTLRYDGTRGATLDLRPATLAGADGGGGFVSFASGIRGGFTIARGVTIENAVGGAGDDRIIGNSAANDLRGGGGNDNMNGSGGADTMLGGLGNDTCFVDNPGDRVIEAPGQGTDIVGAAITYVLPDNVENLTLGGAAAINGFGNALANVLRGNAANNTLSGRLGADSMFGGFGNDTCFVDDPNDRVIEAPGQGTDTIGAAISYTLPDNVENLTLGGAAAINGFVGSPGTELEFAL